MNIIRMKKLVMAGALIAAASAVSAQAADQSAASSTTTYGQRATADQRITNNVVSKLSNDPSLSGKIGVETARGEVTLSGLVNTSGQADRAGRIAESVDGVTEVHDEVNSWVGQF